MALAVGGVAGALGYAVLAKRLRRRRAVLTATLTFGAATVRHRIPCRRCR